MLKNVLDAATRPILLYVCYGLLVIALIEGIFLVIIKKDRDLATANGKVLGVKLEMQNQAVRQWQKEAAAQKELTAAAVAEAGKIQVVTRERVERILAAPVPSTCPEAVLWGAVEGAKQGAEWEKK